MDELTGVRIHVNGVVQGVGFRPFVYGLAQRMGVSGWVRNTSAGVTIEVDGSSPALAEFTRALRLEAPPLARIDDIQISERAPMGFGEFTILHSEAVAGAFQPISPDVSICADCLRELFDPGDRRFRYPFINCTNCGPRFTIIKDIPYDRPLTTMSGFEMCPECAREYQDPLDRRFHAQPLACPACGPKVWLEHDERLVGDDAIQAARNLLAGGKILAVKGLGGFHLACDATNDAAVAELRRRKLRVDKPFALMMPDTAAVVAHCHLDDGEQALLESRERPILILQRRSGSPIVREVAPGQHTLGVMLPYTPLHYLLLERAPGFPEALVMTSGNLCEEPIATGNDEARSRLANLADAFLMNDRDIRTRCDDSVVRLFPSAGRQAIKRDSVSNGSTSKQFTDNRRRSAIYPLRRSRGYAPFPVKLPWESPPLLATGAELKNAFCLTNGRYAFLSHHIGDMENYETLRAFEDGVAHLEHLFRIRPKALAYDLHPDYMATRYALERAGREGVPAIGVQHHHAHVAAAMAENGLLGDRAVIGVSFDGTGLGDDGAIWGGEVLVADYTGYQRPYHLAYVPLPGGDRAVKEPWRMSLAWLYQAGVEWNEDLPPVRYAVTNDRASMHRLNVLNYQLQSGLNSPPTSSMGRLFDAVAALVGVRQVVSYEAQAAIELEALVDDTESGAYPLQIRDGIIDPVPLIWAVAADVRAGVSAGVISGRFHNAVADMVVEVCDLIRQHSGLNEVALSGGVWQNLSLLARTAKRLEQSGFTLYLHRQVPPNDGGLALGQAAIAARRLSERGEQALTSVDWEAEKSWTQSRKGMRLQGETSCA